MVCLVCGVEGKMVVVGLGVEWLVEEVVECFFDVCVSVLFLDLFGSVWVLKEVIVEIGVGEIDIIIGMQLVVKGYNFLCLMLVGVIDVDLGL